MQGICKLCGNDRVLEESHVIPGFVWKWLKGSSGRGYLRFGSNPNKRVQDGYKYYWLCGECEDKFCEWETQFANKVFHPINKDSKSIVSYDGWLLKFCVSISWRVLVHFIEFDGLNHFSKSAKNNALKTHKVWQDFLLGKIVHPGIHEQHFLPLDIIKSHSSHDMPVNINRYILGSIDIDAAWGSENAYIYSKIGKYVIIGFISMVNPREWDGTKVNLKHGVIKPKSYSLPGQFGEYFMDKANRAATVQQNISDKQNKKIEEQFIKNIETLADSNSFIAMENDVRLFGDRAFEKSKK